MTFKNIKNRILKALALSIVVLFQGCGIYSFTGASIPAETKTFQVNFFQNNAPLIEPGLDFAYTNSLQDLLLNQTSLDLVKIGGDLIYEGEIVEYRISPTTATADNKAAQNRLTISVNLRFVNTKNTEDDLEKRFTFFYDYEGSSQLLGSVKETAYEEIFERINQDIFNATLAKW